MDYRAYVQRLRRVISNVFPGGTVLLKKLFRTLVLGGAVAGMASGCAAQAQSPKEKTPESRDAGVAPDAGTAKKDTGSGAQGW